jgi:hypothetical protein
MDSEGERTPGMTQRIKTIMSQATTAEEIMRQQARPTGAASGGRHAPPAGLLADDGGAVLLWTLFVALPVFFALGAIAVDAHRTYNTFDEAQSFADHTALAAAMELNGRPGAIDRAIQAACGAAPGPLVTGTHTYGRAVGGARPLNAGQLVFLSALGADPSAPGQYATAAGDVSICAASCAAPGTCQGLGAAVDATARFVSVTTQPVAVDWLLWPVMAAFGVASPLASANPAARATAGMNKEVCNVPPVWMCNPLQGTGESLNDPQFVGMQMLVISGAPNTPGNFGLVEAFEGQGADKFRDAVSRVNPTDQCTGFVVDTEPGQNSGPVAQGFNVRFDIYLAPMKTTDPLTPPAKNVTKGQVSVRSGGGPNKKCDYLDYDPSTPEEDKTMALPRDSCFSGGTCQPFSGLLANRWGVGDWDCAGYWDMNHGVVPPSGVCASRWATYQHEITNNMIPDKSAIGSENGNPTCSVNGPPDSQLDRRELIVALVDCIGSGINGRAPLPVREYVRVFMTEPIADDGSMYVEYLGLPDPDELSNFIKEYPVLYR